MAANTFRKPTPPQKNGKTSNGKLKSEGQLPIDFGSKKEGLILVIGIFFIVVAAILFLSFLSYYFTGNSDQDLVQKSIGNTLGNTEQKANNLMGVMGAYLSHFFIFQWFGIASFGWIPIILWAGLRLSFKLNPIGINFNTFTIGSIFYIFWTSIFLGYFTTILDLPAGSTAGGLGYICNQFLYQAIGGGGILIILLILVGWLIFFHGYTQIDDWFIAKLFNRSQEVQTIQDEDIAAERIRRAAQTAASENPMKTETPPVSSPIVPASHPEASTSDLEDENLQTVPKPFDDIEIPLSVSPKLEEKETKNSTEPVFTIENSVQEIILDEDEIIHEKILEDFGLFDPTLELGEYQYPSIELLNDYGNNAGNQVSEDELEANKNNIVETMRNFQIGISSIKATIGPTVTLYEIVPEAGVRISKIKNLEDDIALNLAALGIRIIAPMPGKGTIGIEVPNKNREMVTMKSVISSERFQKNTFDLPIILGKTISNEIYVTDLAKMPHLLMAGATGQGKSVGLNVILTSLLYKKHPAQIKFVLVDPKKVELTLYNKIERHFLAMLPNAEEAIITDTKKVVYTLNSLCIEMDNRYNLLKDAGVRNIKEYNAKFVHRKLNPEKGHRFLPYIVLVIDELADLMMTAGKEVEQPIARLAQLARAIGIHLIVATQRPSVNVITGLIKANFPARLSFKVTSKIDSRTILDSGGSEQLVGNGDMLLSMGADMTRLQCPFVDTPEVDEVCEFIGSQKAYTSAYLLPEFYGDDETETLDFDASELDPLFEEAARLLVTHQQGSTSMIQRKMKLGYNRAGRIVDQLEAAGIVGPFDGSKAREVLAKDLTSLEEILKKLK